MIMNALMTDDESLPDDRGDAASQDDQRRPQIVRSEDLLQGRRELWIEHGDEMYRLRLTRAGKLYLTK
jgi:hemin uptake protein HemP